MRVILWCILFLNSNAFAFCGFFVAKGDAKLFNNASQVIVVRHDDKTAITMFNDYKGELSEFALVVPVPEVLVRDQINVADRGLLERVDAFSAPRLVEYFDHDPCSPTNIRLMGTAETLSGGGSGEKGFGVTVEAKYTVGEYDIVILSAKESTGLRNWLLQNGYKIPPAADKALTPYIKQNLKFFVAKVNLAEQAKTGFRYLRPIQFAFESPKFMLPIRLGMANAQGEQDLIIYMITRTGRVETTNYRTVKLPTDQEVPAYIKGKFASFYQDLFKVAHNKEGKNVIFTEYAWNMNWCDPCAADPLTASELKKIGVFWLESNTKPSPGIRPQLLPLPGGGATEAYITRLHVRYDNTHFPEDLFFQETSDTSNFQGRYVIRHPWTEEIKCGEARNYASDLKARQESSARNVASLTGWPIEQVRKDMGNILTPEESTDKGKWYQKIFR